MCGVFGYTGKQIANDLVFQGLKRLEYRGYDSWGIAVNDKQHIQVFKTVGEITERQELKKLPSVNTAIGHTRWATHGGVTTNNAHPHNSENKFFTLVQNGIVENYSELKKSLEQKGYVFKTQTDTEVIVKLIEDEQKTKKPFKTCITKAFKLLKGRNTIVILTKDNDIYAIRNGSPLVIGKSKDGIYLASDALSFSPHTNKVVLLDDHDFVHISNGKIEITNILSKKKNVKIHVLKNKYVDINKGKYAHYMLKEIVEQQNTIISATQYTKKELKPLVEDIQKAHRVYVVGAGTAGFAAGQIAYFLRNISGIDAQDVKSYEFKSYINILSSKDLVIAVSQSGETADTIEVLEIAKKKRCKIASIVNMLGTTISRMSNHQYFTNAGPEICVASTKVFTAQCSWGYLLAKTIANEYDQAQKDVANLSVKLGKFLHIDTYKNVKKIVKKIKNSEHLFVLGKGSNANISLEGALKIKEISYKHIEGFMAGELKHGVIALVEKGTPVFGIISDDQDSKDMISSMEQVKARGALTIGVGDKKFSNTLFDFFIPTPQVNGLSGLSNVIAFQLVSYFLSLELGNNIDKPRNLAKSVTVK
ncbi:MAG TPA: glutamine--fructose-6-phosphate transaminase (isomerizing) [Candidatus Dojkabacteria bacterium]|nr:glutamine--fructose-6-phosphate transaminase (isomerizing) [Candidatus Dojkabacteria bacterium]